MSKRFKMPDLTSAKWQRRDKLNPINFANKGKSGHKQILDAMDKKKSLKQELKENLPVRKVSAPSRIPVGDNFYRQTLQQLLEVPKKTQAIDLHKFRQDQSKIYKKLAQIQVSPNTAQSVLHANSRLGQTQKAEEAFALIPQVTIDEVNALMDAYANARDLGKVTQLFQQHHSMVDMKSYGILIKTLVACDRTDDAFKAYELLKLNLQLPVSMQIYTSLLKACTRSGDVKRAISLFEHVKSVEGNKSERPDALVYSHIIHSCAKGGLVEKAFLYFDEMLQSVDSENKQLVPLDSTFNALIQGCAKNIGKPNQDKYGFQKAFELCELMKDKYGIAPNKITYQYLLLACAQQGDTKRAQSMLQQMKEQDVDITTQAYQWAIASYAQTPVLIAQIHQLEKDRIAKRNFEKTLADGEMGILNEGRVTSGMKPIEPAEYLLSSESYDPNQKVQVNMEEFDPNFVDLKAYVLEGQEPPVKLKELFQEASELFDRVTDDSVHILNAKLNVLGAFHKKQSMMDLYQSMGSIVNPTSQQRVLMHLQHQQVEYCDEPLPSKRFLLESGKQVYQDYEKYRTTHKYPDDWSDLDKKYIAQKYRSQRIGNQQKRTEYHILSSYRNLLDQCRVDSTSIRNLIKQRGLQEHRSFK